MKINITVPSDLSDIKLSQYQKYIKTIKGREEDVDFLNRQLVGVFCDISDELVGKIRKIDFNATVQSISDALSQKANFVTRFKLDGVEYGFIPSLEDITVDEQADIDGFLKDIKTYGKAAAVMYRPIKSKYKDTYLIEDYKGGGEELDVSLEIMLGCIDFFFDLQNELLNFTLNFIDQEVEQSPKLSAILGQNGLGIKTSTHLQKEMFLNLKRSVN
jgi:hypothetical protein